MHSFMRARKSIYCSQVQSKEKEFYSLEVSRALRTYIKHTESFKTTDIGIKVSESTIVRWINNYISL